ncbi:hypothetical protein [Corallococcus llansteffanensis]|uniref:Uncharacterized protein n=1 Tax=Corallococcus llansteffanensis TaxID=2316731 RepID=A0A3A8PMU2_9BACT|nr:hypothetical protein [Corallococcus llansteffanensis]RKH54985.1 hypothetical protein D7V93_24160 [Corallococcus llansteffanensis]
MRHGWLWLALLGLAACGGEEAIRVVPLAEVAGSGVTATLFVEEIPGNPEQVETRFTFTTNDPSFRVLVGFLHEGRCESLGDIDLSDPHAHPFEFYQGTHAFAVHLGAKDFYDPSGAVMACGDL